MTKAGSRRFVAVAIRADGRRVPVQIGGPDNSLLAKFELLVLGLLALITGSRRESGG